MIADLDIRRAAEQVRKMSGEDAAIQSARRADALMDQGDIEGFNMWNRVVVILAELKRTRPRDGEARH